MKISVILDHIDSGHVALPEFQRGYVWNRDQVRGLFDSLYRRHPVGGLLVWVTDSRTRQRGGAEPTYNVVKLLLDGQQRITSLYGVVRGKSPRFFEGNVQAFTGLYFNLETETFAFYQPLKMGDDPLWVNVTELMSQGYSKMGDYFGRLGQYPQASVYIGRLTNLLSIVDIDLHIEEVTGSDKTLDIVVDIFNRVNSGGTKLSKGDLALAKICADWPAARDAMKRALRSWEDNGFRFNLDWLLRCINTVITGEARFTFLHDQTAADIEDGLNRACKAIDTCLNMIIGRLGLDHDAVLFGRYAIPVMVRYLDKEKCQLGAMERDRLLFWYLQSAMWGRFSGSTESFIDQDLAALEAGGVGKLLDQLRLWHGGLQVDAGHFAGWSTGARFYPVLYWLTRMGEAKDWGSGLPLRQGLLGKGSQLEVHHIFPKAQLYRHGYARAQVNALANYCFLTKNTNIRISDRLPQEYFEEVEKMHPGTLESQWIPTDRELWKLENYPRFLEARQSLLAAEANRHLAQLLHGDTSWLVPSTKQPVTAVTVVGGVTSGEEETELNELNQWVVSFGLPAGKMAFDYTDAETGMQKAVFDLVWANGLQEQRSEPVAVLLNEDASTIALASTSGFRCFTSIQDFKRYVMLEILNDPSLEERAAG